MVSADELRSDNFQNVGEVLVVQHVVDVLLALLAGLLVGPQFPNLLVFGLQFV